MSQEQCEELAVKITKAVVEHFKGNDLGAVLNAKQVTVLLGAMGLSISQYLAPLSERHGEHFIQTLRECIAYDREQYRKTQAESRQPC